MFKFANPEYLYLLVLVPVLVALHVFSNIRRRMKLSEYGDRVKTKEKAVILVVKMENGI